MTEIFWSCEQMTRWQCCFPSQ